MPGKINKVVPIHPGISATQEGREIADLAYQYWLARCFRDGSPEEDWLAAVREVRAKGVMPMPKPAGLFLVRKPRCLPTRGS